jgi:hypothetical protein
MFTRRIELRAPREAGENLRRRHPAVRPSVGVSRSRPRKRWAHPLNRPDPPNQPRTAAMPCWRVAGSNALRRINHSVQHHGALGTAVRGRARDHDAHVEDGIHVVDARCA